MGQIYDTLIEHLEEHNVRFQRDDENEVVKMMFTGPNGKWLTIGQARQEQDRLLICSAMPLDCPEDRRSGMCEFITRLNWAINIGCFEMDLSDGEIRYRTLIDLGDGELNSKMVKALMLANFQMMDTFFKGFFQVIYSQDTALEAFEACEKARQARRKSVNTGQNSSSTIRALESIQQRLTSRLDRLDGPGGSPQN